MPSGVIAPEFDGFEDFPSGEDYTPRSAPTPHATARSSRRTDAAKTGSSVDPAADSVRPGTEGVFINHYGDCRRSREAIQQLAALTKASEERARKIARGDPPASASPPQLSIGADAQLTPPQQTALAIALDQLGIAHLRAIISSGHPETIHPDAVRRLVWQWLEQCAPQDAYERKLSELTLLTWYAAARLLARVADADVAQQANLFSAAAARLMAEFRKALHTLVVYRQSRQQQRGINSATEMDRPAQIAGASQLVSKSRSRVR